MHPTLQLYDLGTTNPYGFFDEILIETQLALNANAISPAVLSIYVAIDTMAYLSLPLGKDTQGKTEFINWVERYLKTDLTQSYQYTGKDIYGARCAKLHAFSSNSKYAKDNHCMLYSYSTYKDHTINYPGTKKEYVLISVPLLLSDLEKAINNFCLDIQKDSSLKACVDSRKNGILRILNVKQ